VSHESGTSVTSFDDESTTCKATAVAATAALFAVVAAGDTVVSADGLAIATGVNVATLAAADRTFSCCFW
jgi:bifunctional ADP-heptose synthase (sugar kinase/adenylyltransferase)